MSANGEEKHNGDESSAFYANNDASSYNSRYLKSIRNKERFQELHFFAAPTDLIDELFPKQAGKGSLNPISSFRASAATLNEWRDLDEADQLIAIEKEKETAIEEDKEKAQRWLKRLLELDPSTKELVVFPDIDHMEGLWRTESDADSVAILDLIQRLRQRWVERVKPKV